MVVNHFPRALEPSCCRGCWKRLTTQLWRCATEHLERNVCRKRAARRSIWKHPEGPLNAGTHGGALTCDGDELCARALAALNNATFRLSARKSRVASQTQVDLDMSSERHLFNLGRARGILRTKTQGKGRSVEMRRSIDLSFLVSGWGCHWSR